MERKEVVRSPRTISPWILTEYSALLLSTRSTTMRIPWIGAANSDENFRNSGPQCCLRWVRIARNRKDRIMRKYLTFFLAVPIVCLLGSCSNKPAASEANYTLVATIKDIMDSQVDPSADYIWQSIGTEVSAAGILEKRPQNPDEWKEERRRAILLVEAANLLIMPGRRVAKAGEKADNPEVELGPEEIQALI